MTLVLTIQSRRFFTCNDLYGNVDANRVAQKAALFCVRVGHPYQVEMTPTTSNTSARPVESLQAMQRRQRERGRVQTVLVPSGDRVGLVKRSSINSGILKCERFLWSSRGLYRSVEVIVWLPHRLYFPTEPTQTSANHILDSPTATIIPLASIRLAASRVARPRRRNLY